MLLFNKISLIEQVLRLLHISHQTGRNLTVHRFINVHFKFYVQKYCCMKMQNNVSGKSQDYYTTMSHQEKRQPVES